MVILRFIFSDVSSHKMSKSHQHPAGLLQEELVQPARRVTTWKKPSRKKPSRKVQPKKEHPGDEEGEKKILVVSGK